MPKHKLNAKTFALFSKLFIEECRKAKAPKEVFLNPEDKQRLLNATPKAQLLSPPQDKCGSSRP